MTGQDLLRSVDTIVLRSPNLARLFIIPDPHGAAFDFAGARSQQRHQPVRLRFNRCCLANTN